MKLLFLANKSSHGGSLKMLTWLANSLSYYYDVTYCNMSSDTPFYQLNNKIKYISLKCSDNNTYWYRNSIGLLRSFLKLYKLQKEESYDLVINFSDHALYPLILVKMLTGVKILVSQRVDPYSARDRSERFRLSLYKYCDGLVCQTKSALDFFSSQIKEKTKAVVINNPAIRKAKDYWNPNEEHLYIVSLARIDIPQKRQDILVEAFSIVHEAHPAIKLYLYGKASQSDIEEISDIIKKFGLESNVFYKGVTDSPLKVLHDSIMLVLSSDFEGIPNAILEAMDVGVPIVSTDCSPGGARLLIGDNENGILVPCGDVQRLAEAMIFIIENKDKSTQMAINAQQSLNRFSESQITNKWIEYINRVISSDRV